MPRAPHGLEAAGKRLWKAVTAEYELSGADAVLLEQACHVADRIAKLEELAGRAVLARTRLGEVTISPPVRELRAQAIVLARLLAALRVVGDVAQDEEGRPQARAGFRGVYSPLKVVDDAETAG